MRNHLFYLCSLLLTVRFVSVLEVGLNVCFLVNENCIYLFIYFKQKPLKNNTVLVWTHFCF